MKENFRIYLAGAMSGLSFEEMSSWRLDVINRVKRIYPNDYKVRVVNPVDYYNFKEVLHQSELEVMKFDLNKVKKSDLVIVNMEHLNTSIGTIVECYEAHKNDIPVLAFGSDELYGNLHPWIQCCITRHDPKIADTLKYVKDFYLT